MNEDKLLELAKRAIATMVDLGTDDAIIEAIMEEGYSEEEAQDFVDECCK